VYIDLHIVCNYLFYIKIYILWKYFYSWFNATFHNISVISWRILLWYACIIYHTNTSGIDEYILKLQSKDTQTVRTFCFCATAVTCCTKVSWSYSLTWNIQDLNTITSIFNCHAYHNNIRHDITEILWKVALNTIIPSK
jgi:hypothetical protein